MEEAWQLNFYDSVRRVYVLLCAWRGKRYGGYEANVTDDPFVDLLRIDRVSWSQSTEIFEVDGWDV